MVGAAAGPENFKTTQHKDLAFFQGSAQPWLHTGLNSNIGKFLLERRDVNANTGSTGTLTQGSGFAEVDLAMDADFCGMITAHWTRAALTASTAAQLLTYGAPFFRDNEFCSSIDKLQLRQGGKVVYEITGEDMAKLYRQMPYQERAKYAPGMGADMSVGERRLRGSASCDVYGPLLLPWTVHGGSLKSALPLRGHVGPITVRIYFASLASAVMGPPSTSGGALTALSLRQDNYHVEEAVASQVALQVARGAYQIPYIEFLRQGAVSVTGVSTSVDTTTTIQLTNFKRHSFAVEVDIQYSTHLLNLPEDNVDHYSLPAKYVRLLSGSKQINVEEDYTPIAECVASPVESLRYQDNATMFKGKPANQVRNIVALCPLKTFDACLQGEFNNLRALQLYQDLQLQVVTVAKLATPTRNGFYRGAHEYQQIGYGSDTITADAFTYSVVSYGANALIMRNGKLHSLFSV